MLTILIKAYCVNVVIDIKPIYLNKRYSFQNNGAVTLEIYSSFYHSDYGNYNFIADSQCDSYIFYANEYIQFCMISWETLPVKADFNHA